MPDSKFEIIGNFHLHTYHSDGVGSHRQVAWAAAQAGLDVIVVTDHNVWVAGKEGWYTHPETGHKALLLMGEEVHDEGRSPEVNHYLCLGVDREMREYASQPQALIDAVDRCGGVGFIAHPQEQAAPLFNEPALPWVDWDVVGFAGIELWNYMSEFKNYLPSKPVAVLAAFFPSLFISGPPRATLSLWDDLMRDGQKVVAIGGADAHANVYSLGPLRRAVFPYTFLFKALNTHLLLDSPLSSELVLAKAQVLSALRTGRAFVAYDMAGDSRGFRFTATGQGASAGMGDEIPLNGPITFRVSSPLPASLRLLKDGRQVARVRGQELTYEANEPGVFRVEAYRRYRMKSRGWIFSNPIYVSTTH
ncbi:MAG: CehA/McbA family metallohydrolase [Anaerolineales bacterium]|nr:MAG: CehA/McbA family metallohydrolase [Anaerolineales bacterium]